MKIYYHPRFKKSYKKLPPEIKRWAEAGEEIFQQNIFDPKLDTHKLHGKLKNFWSFSIDQKYRVLFEKIGKDVVFLDVGNHDIYQ